VIGRPRSASGEGSLAHETGERGQGSPGISQVEDFAIGLSRRLMGTLVGRVEDPSQGDQGLDAGETSLTKGSLAPLAAGIEAVSGEGITEWTIWFLALFGENGDPVWTGGGLVGAAVPHKTSKARPVPHLFSTADGAIIVFWRKGKPEETGMLRIRLAGPVPTYLLPRLCDLRVNAAGSPPPAPRWERRDQRQTVQACQEQRKGASS
jgi:hypothetical protein